MEVQLFYLQLDEEEVPDVGIELVEIGHYLDHNKYIILLKKFRSKMIMWGFEYDTDHTHYAHRTYERWSHSAFVKEDRLRCRDMIHTPDLHKDVIANKCKREDCNKIRAKTRISGSGDNTVMQDFTYCSIHIEECENKLVYGLDKADVIKAKKDLVIGKANQVTLLVKRMKRGKVVTK